jgi:hypothetical protein
MDDFIEELLDFIDFAAVTLTLIVVGTAIIIGIIYMALYMDTRDLRALRSRVQALKGRHGLALSEVVDLLGPPQDRTQTDQHGNEFITWRIDHGVVGYQSKSLFEGGSTSLSGSIKASYSATLRFSQGRLAEIYKEESIGF